MSLSLNQRKGYNFEIKEVLEFFKSRLDSDRFEIIHNPIDEDLWVQHIASGVDLIIVDKEVKKIYLIECKDIDAWNPDADWASGKIVHRFHRETRHHRYLGYKKVKVVLSDGYLPLTKEAFHWLQNDCRIRVFSDKLKLYFNVIRKPHSKVKQATLN